MKHYFLIALILASCSVKKDNIVSQKFTHKYGIETSKDQWIARNREGSIEEVLSNGVRILSSYKKGKLHGECTESFPYSTDIAKKYTYENGIIVKERLIDKEGIPIVENSYLSESVKAVINWDNLGAPIRKEKYINDKLIEGVYYNPIGEIEATVKEGSGTRIKRDRIGAILLVDVIVFSDLVKRYTYHSNGSVHIISNFKNDKLEGDQKIYNPNGDLYMILPWHEGKLEGKKMIFKNNKPFWIIPHKSGMKSGIAECFNEEGGKISQTSYSEDKKHGKSIVYGKEAKIEWYYMDEIVTKEEFNNLTYRKKLEEISENKTPFDTLDPNS